MGIFSLGDEFIGTVGSVSFIFVKRQIAKAFLHFYLIRRRLIGFNRLKQVIKIENLEEAIDLIGQLFVGQSLRLDLDFVPGGLVVLFVPGKNDNLPGLEVVIDGSFAVDPIIEQLLFIKVERSNELDPVRPQHARKHIAVIVVALQHRLCLFGLELMPDAARVESGETKRLEE